MGRLAGRVALVTGGSRGIGEGIARRLAAEGADVAVTYARSATRARAVVAELEAGGRRGLALEADAADPVAVTAAVEATVSTFGRLDILVNNAGIITYGRLAETTVEAFDEIVAVNVRAVFVASRAAARHMRDGGRIVTIGSNLAGRLLDRNLTLYALSKSALVGLTKGMARDLGPDGITVNLVHPGSTGTDMNPVEGPSADEQRARMAIPRFGDPGDIAGLVAWLASGEGRFATGAEFTIDGGANA